MKKVRYLAKSDSHLRVLRPSDLVTLGIEPTSEDLVFSCDNDFTVEMENEACETLVAKLPEEFVLLEAPDEIQAREIQIGSDNSPVAPNLDQSGPAIPEGSSSDSEGDEITNSENSSPTRMKIR